ncbi:hypothetical protein GCM10009678_33480 [Actinomadura kijaniata]
MAPATAAVATVPATATDPTPEDDTEGGPADAGPPRFSAPLIRLTRLGGADVRPPRRSAFPESGVLAAGLSTNLRAGHLADLVTDRPAAE